MKASVKVSVLIPIYNVEPYIGRCVESLFTQTYTQAEYIFVDDCSPDGSVQILRQTMTRYPDVAERVTIIRHERNMGLGQTRQDALDVARGEYVTIVDSDDYVSPRMLEILVARAEQTGADIVDGAYRQVGCRHEHLRRPVHKSDETFRRLLLCGKASGFVWGKLYRRSLFTDYDIRFRPDICYAEDYAKCGPLYLVGRRAYTDECIYYYRCDNPTSYTNTIDHRSIISHAKAGEVVRQFYALHDPQGRYGLALQFSLLNVYRHACRRGADIATCVEPYLHLELTHPMLRLYARMYQVSRLSPVAAWLFRTHRRMYISYLKLFCR